MAEARSHFKKVDENYIDLNYDDSNENYINLNFDDSHAEYISGDELYDTSGVDAYDTYDYDTNYISDDYDDNSSGDDADEKIEDWNTPEGHINA